MSQDTIGALAMATGPIVGAFVIWLWKRYRRRGIGRIINAAVWLAVLLVVATDPNGKPYELFIPFAAWLGIDVFLAWSISRAKGREPR